MVGPPWSEAATIRKEVDGRLHFYNDMDTGLHHLRGYYGGFAEGRWMHVAGTWDGTTQRLYLNGVEVDSNEPPFGSSLPEIDQVFLSIDGEPLNGMLDDVRLYNYALSEAEIAYLATEGTGHFPLLSPANLYEDPNIDIVLDNFESYADQSDLEASWIVCPWCTAEATRTLLTDPCDAHSGSQAMRWGYNMAEQGTYSELIYQLDSPVDLSQYDEMRLWVKRHAGNSCQDMMYVKFIDTTIDFNGIAAVSFIDDDTTCGHPDEWYCWVIDLHRDLVYDEPGVSCKYECLSQINNMVGLLIGTCCGPGSGTVDIDDIKLYHYQRVDFKDYAIFAEDWLKEQLWP